MALVSLTDLKTALGVSGTGDDAFLTLHSEIISEAIEGYCNRKFAQTSYIQIFYRKDFCGHRPSELTLYHYPLIGTPVVTEDGTPVVDFRFHLPTAKLDKNSGSFFANSDQVVVTYTAGYATLPALLKNIVISLVQERLNKKNAGVDINFGRDVQRISIPGAIAIDFDYSLNDNERKNAYGSILGSNLNVLDSFRSERSLIGEARISYVQ